MYPLENVTVFLHLMLGGAVRAVRAGAAGRAGR